LGLNCFEYPLKRKSSPRCRFRAACTMYRKALIDLLLNRPTRLYDIARPLQLHVKDVEDDLIHLKKTLKHEPYRLLIHPAQCRRCGFVFSTEDLHKPGTCPECKGTWISQPLFEIVPR